MSLSGEHGRDCGVRVVTPRMTGRRRCVTASRRSGRDQATFSVRHRSRRSGRPRSCHASARSPSRRRVPASRASTGPAMHAPIRPPASTSATRTAALPRSFARFDSRCVSSPMRSIAASTLGVEQLDDQHLQHRRRSAARARPASTGSTHASGNSTAASAISWRNALSCRNASRSPDSENRSALNSRRSPRWPLCGLSAKSASAHRRLQVVDELPRWRVPRRRRARAPRRRRAASRSAASAAERRSSSRMPVMPRLRRRRWARSPDRPPPACRRPSPRASPGRTCRCGSGNTNTSA